MKTYIKSLILTLLLSFGFLSLAFVASAEGIPAINSPGSSGTSLNWAGYAISGNNITSVNGSWTIPQIATSAGLTSDAAWIGIGGISSKDLIQIGTEDFSQNGQLKFQAFYETLPQTSTIIPISVNAGDSISASLTQQSPGQWYLSLRNNNGQSFQTTVNYNSSLSSAEWIEEMPSNSNNSFVSLDNFSSVQFGGATMVENGATYTISQIGAQPLTMITGNNVALATPSSLGADGESFTVTRTSATPTPSTNWQRTSSPNAYRRGMGVQGYTRAFNNGRFNRTTSFTTTTQTNGTRTFTIYFSRIFSRR